VTGGAKALEIGEIERQFRIGSDRLDMIDFQPSARAALNAFEFIAAKGFEAQRFPASGFKYRF